MEHNSYRTDFRKCSLCKETKPAIEFKGKRATYCVPCFREYRKLNRQKHKENPEWSKREKPQSAEKRLERRQYYIEYLSSKSCVTCGESDPIVLEFNHIDPSLKHKGVAELMHQGTLDELKVEIDKCEILCANCHKRHTAKQAGWFWLSL